MTSQANPLLLLITILFGVTSFIPYCSTRLPRQRARTKEIFFREIELHRARTDVNRVNKVHYF